MMVCMPRTCGVLLRTLSVWGRGWHWWAEANAALEIQIDWNILSKSPFLTQRTSEHHCGDGHVQGGSCLLAMADPRKMPCPLKCQAKVRMLNFEHGTHFQ